MIQDENKRIEIQNITLAVATLMLLVAAAMPIFGVHGDWAKYLYSLGALAALAERCTERYAGKNLRIRRLFRMGKVSALLYCVSAFFLFSSTLNINIGTSWGNRDWLAFLLAGALLQIYASFAIQHEENKEKKKQAGANNGK